jgi:hypothetical protein
MSRITIALRLSDMMSSVLLLVNHLVATKVGQKTRVVPMVFIQNYSIGVGL